MNRFKFFRKKLCVVGLVAASVFAGVAAPMVVSMTHTEEAQAGTNGHGRDWVAGWAAGKIGTQVDYDGVWGAQCVDLIQMYAKDLGQYLPSLNAYEYGNSSCKLPSGWRRYGNNTEPKVGDIYVNNKGAYGAGASTGHVGVIVEVRSNGYTCVDYRSYGRDGKYHVEGHYRDVSGQRSFSYIIRPDFPDSIPPTPQPDINTYWPIADGYYTIKTEVGNKFLDVSGMSTADRANIQIWDPFGAHTGQIFKVARNGTGYYIQNLNSGKFADTTITGRNTKNPVGADNVMQYYDDGTKGQRWIFEAVGNGNYFIKNLYGYYLDVTNGVDANGTNVGTWKKNGSAAQQWKFTRVSGKNLASIAEGDYMIYSKVGNRVLNAAGDGTGNGTNLWIWDPLDVNGNIFTVSKDGRFVTKIKNKAANRMVDSKGGQNKPEDVHLWDYNNGLGQNWYIEDAGDGYVYIRNLWGYYLDVVNGINSNGTNVQTWYFNGSDAQKWKFVKYNRVAVNSVSLDSSSRTVAPDDLFMLTASVSPSNATNKDVSWSSSNTNVATVDASGVVRAKNPGTATITVRTADGGKTASCTVTVKAKDTRTGLYKVNNSWIYLKNGTMDGSFTGLAKAPSGKWYHVTKGRYDTTYTGLSKAASGKWYYVKDGKYDTSFTGLAKAPSGKWYHVTNGKYDTTYTGLSQAASGKWYYVRKGKYDTTFSGKVKYNGRTYTVKNGKLV